jgi:hypothetical protein
MVSPTWENLDSSIDERAHMPILLSREWLWGAVFSFDFPSGPIFSYPIRKILFLYLLKVNGNETC